MSIKDFWPFVRSSEEAELRPVGRPRGPHVIGFSLEEVRALANYAVPYPLEEATPKERAAFESAMEKIKRKATSERAKAQTRRGRTDVVPEKPER